MSGNKKWLGTDSVSALFCLSTTKWNFQYKQNWVQQRVQILKDDSIELKIGRKNNIEYKDHNISTVRAVKKNELLEIF